MSVDTVQIGPFVVADLSYADVVDRAASLACEPTSPQRFYALHVSGLNARGHGIFVDEMNGAELVCADGGSVVLLAKLAGARRLERVPTTDAGWDVLRAVCDRLGRPARIALVGAEPGTAGRAAEKLEEGGAGRVVMVEHGFHNDWASVLERLRDGHPDVCIIGMGAPREMLWVREHLTGLPPALIMTCGGWFGFLSGEEQRAPALLRRSGLEWIARVAQAPGRLLPRYAKGLRSVAALAVDTLTAGRRR